MCHHLPILLMILKSGTSVKSAPSKAPLFIISLNQPPILTSFGVNEGQVWEVKLVFDDGSDFTLPYSDLIHLKWRRGANTVIGGGDDNGQADDYDIIRTIDSLDKTIQGLPKSIEASLQIKGDYLS